MSRHAETAFGLAVYICTTRSMLSIRLIKLFNFFVCMEARGGVRRGWGGVGVLKYG